MRLSVISGSFISLWRGKASLHRIGSLSQPPPRYSTTTSCLSLLKQILTACWACPTSPQIHYTHTQVYTNTKHLCALIKSLSNRCFLTVGVTRSAGFANRELAGAGSSRDTQLFCDLLNAKTIHEANFSNEINLKVKTETID